jgi:hypothetical protein
MRTKVRARPSSTTAPDDEITLDEMERITICDGILTRAQDPKDAIEYTPVTSTRATPQRPIRQQRPNPFIVGEFTPHDSNLPLGSLNHDPAACLDSERIDPSDAKS